MGLGGGAIQAGGNWSPSELPATVEKRAADLNVKAADAQGRQAAGDLDPEIGRREAVGCTGGGERHRRDLERAEGSAIDQYLGCHVLKHQAREVDDLKNPLGGGRAPGLDLLGQGGRSSNGAEAKRGKSSATTRRGQERISVASMRKRSAKISARSGIFFSGGLAVRCIVAVLPGLQDGARMCALPAERLGMLALLVHHPGPAAPVVARQRLGDGFEPAAGGVRIESRW